MKFFETFFFFVSNSLFLYIKFILQVLEIINTALHNLPDSSDGENSMSVNTELFDNIDSLSNDSADRDIYTELDKQMCEIVDAL